MDKRASIIILHMNWFLAHFSLFTHFFPVCQLFFSQPHHRKSPTESFCRGSVFLYRVCEKLKCSLLQGVLIMGEVQKNMTLIVSKLESCYGPSDRIRTCGIVVPNHARYQLRYTRILRKDGVSRKSVAIIQHPPRGSKRKIPRGAERQSA